ncbi:MAG: HAD family hydrolase, partial [Nitriliruptoraceae bacterium]
MSEDPRDVSGLAGPAPTAVVFDVGEVLIDETRVFAIWADLLGVSPLSLGAVFGAAIVQGQDDRAVFPHVAANVDWEDLVDEHERRYGGFEESDLYPDARPCLEELAQQGMTIVLAGNQPAVRRRQLEALELPCDAVRTSHELGCEKPDPAFFDAVLELTGVEDAGHVLYVGDRVDNDVVPAVARGLRTC